MFNNETLKQTPAKPILKHGLHQYVYFGPREEENLLNDSGQGIEPPAAHRVRLVHPTIFGAARRSRSGLGTGGGGLTLSPGTFGGGFARISRESLLSRSASGTEVHHYYQNNDRVRFLDRVSWRSISPLNITPSSVLDHPYRNFTEGSVDLEPNYLPGFVELFYSNEVTIKESWSFCLYKTFEIFGSNKKLIYEAVKKTDGLAPACCKLCLVRECDPTRVGYSVDMFNHSAHNAKLLTFRRRTQWFANSTDIVDAYYSSESVFIGRIDRTPEGFRLVDNAGTIHYRVVSDGKQMKRFTAKKSTLNVICYATGVSVAKVFYWKRRCFTQTCSLLFRGNEHTVKWSPGGVVDIIGRLLIIGALFLELHIDENFVDLPLPPRYHLLKPKGKVDD